MQIIVKLPKSSSVIERFHLVSRIIELTRTIKAMAELYTARRKDHFPQLKDVVYLDHTGATLPSAAQLEAFHRDLTENLYGNPHSRSASSTLCTESVDQVRFRILKYFNTSPDAHTVIFTSGCTAALRLLAESFDWSGQRSLTHRAGEGDGSDPTHHTRTNPSKDTPGLFCYLQDNHTSVVGMREIAHLKGAEFLCVDENITSRAFQSHDDLGGNISDRESGHTQNPAGCHSYSTDHEHLFAGRGVCDHLQPCNLFVYPAQSNFCGRKYPLSWGRSVKDGNLGRYLKCPGEWFVALDAAALVSTSALNLSMCEADFVAVSFYKMFGFPTGLGALIVRNESAYVLGKEYFGGGTVMAYLSNEHFSRKRNGLAESLEDGTLPFLNIIALRHGLDTLEQLGGGMDAISGRTFTLAKYVHSMLSNWQHSNGQAIAELYTYGQFESADVQGPIVNFNLLRPSGEYVGYAEVERLAALNDIHLRTGCFCNTGACQQYLRISNEDIRANLDAGHVCGDDVDLIDGHPTGSVRISFGYMSNQDDADRFLAFIRSCFVDSDLHQSGALTGLNSMTLNETTLLEDTSSGELSSSSIQEAKTARGMMQSSCVISSPSSSNTLPNMSSVASPSPSPSSSASSSLSSSSSSLSVLPVLALQSVQSPVVLESKTASSLTSSSSSLSSSFTSTSTSGLPSCPAEAHTQSEDITARVQISTTAVRDQCITSSSKRCLTAIYIYPVKSCGALEVNEWEVGRAGLKYDRQWMVVNDGGVYMSQKRIPRLCLIKPRIDLEKKQLILTHADMPTFALPLEMPRCTTNEMSLCEGKVCGDRVNTIDCGDEVAAWLTEVTGQRCRLQQQDANYHRLPKRSRATSGKSSSSSLSLANQSQYLLVTTSSSTSLLSALQRASQRNDDHATITAADLISRFRPNLVVEGWEPFDEEGWSRISIGSQQFEVKGCCNRCQMICIDQTTGEKTMEPLLTLSAVRGKKILFGVHVMNGPSFKEGTRLKRGDKIEVQERQNSLETAV